MVKKLFVILCLLPVSNLCATTWKLNTQDFPPFTYYNEHKEVVGPAVELVATICQAAQIDCHFHLLPWARAQKEVKEKHAEGMFVIGWNAKRKDFLHFSPPIFSTQYGFFVNKTSTIDAVTDLQGKTVAVYGPSNTQNSLTKFRDMMVQDGMKPIHMDVETDDIPGFKKVNFGGVPAVYSNRDVGLAIMRSNKLDNMRYAFMHRKLNYYIGFRQDHVNRADVMRFNNAYVEMHAKGEVAEILKKYYMEAPDLNENPKHYELQ